MASYAYFWPSYAVLAGGGALVLITTNVILYAICIILYYLVPSHIMEDTARHIAKCIRGVFLRGFEKIERNIRKTFRIHILHPIPQRSINIWHPHGLLAMTPGIHNSIRVTSKNYKPTKMVTANIFHIFPFVRDWMAITHTINADYSTIRKTLDNESVSVILGGAKEMYLSDGKKLKLVIKERRGIFNLALQTGSPLVPIMTYGESELFPILNSELYTCIREFFYDMWKIPIALPTLTSVQNWLSLWDGPLPAIRSYTGKPIIVKKIENPSEKHIRALRNIYIRRVQELFDETNPGDYTLEII